MFYNLADYCASLLLASWAKIVTWSWFILRNDVWLLSLLFMLHGGHQEVITKRERGRVGGGGCREKERE